MNRMNRYMMVIALACSTLVLSGCATYSDRQFIEGQKAYKEQNYYSAFKDLHMAATYNNHEAQYVTGYMYYYGIGVEQNDYLAHLWLYRAASFGNEKAIDALNAMDRTHFNPALGAIKNPLQPHIPNVHPTPRKKQAMLQIGRAHV